MKIFITGANGQLGNDLALILNSNNLLLSDLDSCDITNFDQAKKIITDFLPDIIINCAAYTNVDDCEVNKDIADLVNSTGPMNLAKIASNINCLLIHISTDYVFDGKKNVPDKYIEDDSTFPISVYGKTKLSGEKNVILYAKKYIIIRTAWLYGINAKKNFLKTMLKLSLNNSLKEIKVVNDQFGSPTWTYRLSLQIQKLIDSKSTGIYHASSEGYCSWYEFAKHFIEKTNLENKIIPCKSHEYKTLAKRPKNSILKNNRLINQNINIMENWKNDIDLFVSKYKDILLREC